MYLFVLSQGWILDSCNLNFWNFWKHGQRFFKNFKKLKNNLIYAKVAHVLWYLVDIVRQKRVVSVLKCELFTRSLFECSPFANIISVG
jgi:hypothetical protein